MLIPKTNSRTPAMSGTLMPRATVSSGDKPRLTATSHFLRVYYPHPSLLERSSNNQKTSEKSSTPNRHHWKRSDNGPDEMTQVPHSHSSLCQELGMTTTSHHAHHHTRFPERRRRTCSPPINNSTRFNKLHRKIVDLWEDVTPGLRFHIGWRGVKVRRSSRSISPGSGGRVEWCGPGSG